MGKHTKEADSSANELVAFQQPSDGPQDSVGGTLARHSAA